MYAFGTRESILCVDNIRTRRNSPRPSVLAPFRGSPSGRSLERGHALLSSASRPAPGGGKAARPRGCVWLPPRSAKPPCPSRGLACRCVPPQQLGRAVGSFYVRCRQSRPPCLFLAVVPASRLGRVQSCSLGGFPQTPLPHIMMMIFTILLKEIIIII